MFLEAYFQFADDTIWLAIWDTAGDNVVIISVFQMGFFINELMRYEHITRREKLKQRLSHKGQDNF